MKNEIIKALKSYGFETKNQDHDFNKRMGIEKTLWYADKYAEIIKQSWGYTVFIYGIVNGYYPWSCDIVTSRDIKTLDDKLKATMKRVEEKPIDTSINCRKCGNPHRLNDNDAGSDREMERLCIGCFQQPTI